MRTKSLIEDLFASTVSLPFAEFFKLQIGETLIKCSRHAHQSLITLIVSRPCSKSLSNCSCICMAFMAEKESSFSGINSNYIFINHQTNAKISEVALVNAHIKHRRSIPIIIIFVDNVCVDCLVATTCRMIETWNLACTRNEYSWNIYIEIFSWIKL